MGFECGIDKVKKFGDITVYGFNIVDSVIGWLGNDWNFTVNPNTHKAPYPTWEEYWESQVKVSDTEICPKRPDDNVINYYRENKEGEYGSISKCLWRTCSIGREFDDFITNELSEYKVDTYTYQITREFVVKCIVWAVNKLNQMKLVPYWVNKSFREVDTDDRFNADILLSSCDGIEAVDENGNVKRVYTANEEYGEPIFISGNSFDIDEYELIMSLLETLIPLLDFDFTTNLIWYWRSF